MSDQVWTATVSRIDPIPGKDRIELVTIDGYQAIVPKDDYRVGDKVCYISEQSLVPDTLLAELGLTGRLAGSGKNRVKAIKMGGALSQGIVCRPAAWINWEKQSDQGQAVPALDDLLGVSKWTPKIPVQLMGKIGRPRGNAPIIAMYDIENIKKLRHFDVSEETWWDPFQGHMVEVTEKIHGTNIGIHTNTDGMTYVYSKGVGQRGWALVEDDSNVYWRAVHKYPGVLHDSARMARQGNAVTYFGEVFGRGIQDMGYDTEFDMAMFDLRTEHSGVVTWHSVGSLNDHALEYDFRTVPTIATGEYDWEKIETMSKEPSTVNGGLREGVVVRSLTWPTNHLGVPHKAKFINPAYLTRKGDTTEFN